jgi:hypothetical protein
MKNTLSFLTSPDFVAAATAIHTLAAIIVNNTKTPKDDRRLRGIEKVWALAYPWIEKAAFIWTAKAKQ